MRWLTVRSSQVANVSYDPGDETLYVQFNGTGDKIGPVYRYEGVSSEVFIGLISADSIGHYLSTSIKGHYPYHKVDHPELLDIHV